MTDQRRHIRYQIEWEVEVSMADWSDVLTLTATSVSRGGLFVRATQPAQVGATVRVSLFLPDDSRVNLVGEVVRTVESGGPRPPGFAVRFTTRQATDLVLLESMARAFGSEDSGDPSQRRPMQVSVITKQVSTEETTIEIEEEAEEVAPPELEPEPDEHLESKPTTERQALAKGKGSSYDVGEQIELGMTGEIVEAPMESEQRLTFERGVPVGTAVPAETGDEIPVVLMDPEPVSLPSEAAVAVEPIELEDEARTEPEVEEEATPVMLQAPAEAPATVALDVQVKGLPPPSERDAADEAEAFGIDFGTSYTSIALVYQGRAVVLEDEEGQTLVPTAVSYPDKGSPALGWKAREQLPTHPSTTFTSPKRLIGRIHDDPNLQPYLTSSPVRFNAGPGGQVVADIYGSPVSIVQVCADVFRHIATIGEQRAGRPVRKVGLAAPVGFEEPQRAAIARAAKMAGLEVVAMVDEPVAAAMAYMTSLADKQLIAVYDFGGGTFDFTLLRTGSGRYRIIGEAGDPWLGGDDFDLALAGYVADQFWQRSKVDLRQRQVEWQRLVFLCERAKRQLTQQEETVVEAKGMALSIHGRIDLEVPLDRTIFAEHCLGLVERSIEAMGTCFAAVGVDPGDVDQVVLTGGVSRIPLVRERVEEYFQCEIPLTLNPEEAVAMGAALSAHQSAGARAEAG